MMSENREVLMSTYRIDDRVWVPRPIEEVFEFFSQPENLSILTPPELSFLIMTPTPVPMHEDAVIDYRITLGPLPMKWRSLISEYNPPHSFVDEQLQGPYASWRHYHGFETSDDGTVITDRVDYAMPYGPLGTLVHAAVVRRRLRRIFGFRRETIAMIFTEDSHA